MSDHFDYMPKPEGWIPPVSDSKPDSASESEKLPSSSEKDDAVSETIVADTDSERKVTLLSNILSWAFVPIMIPVYGAMLIFSLSILSMAPFDTKLVFTLIVFGVNVVAPMLAVLLLKKMDVVSDIRLNVRRERTIPYLMMVVCLLGTGFFLYMKGAPMWVAMFYSGGSLAALVNMIVNFRWKISSHAAGIAGIVAALIQIMKEGSPSGDITWWIVASIILCGMLCSARVWLGKHTLMQVIAGSAVGFLCVWTLSLLC